MRGWLVGVFCAVAAVSAATNVRAGNLTLIASNTPGWSVETVDWSKDDRFIASGQANSVFPQLAVYSFQTGNIPLVVTQRYSATRSVNSVRWNDKSYTLAVGLSPDYTSQTDLFVYAYDSSNNFFSATNGVDLGVIQPANAVSWRPGLSQITVGTANLDATSFLRLYNYSGAGMQTAVTYNAFVSRTVQPGAMAWNSSGTYIALGLESGGNPYPLAVLGFNGTSFYDAGSANPSGSQPVRALAWNSSANVIAIGLLHIAPQQLQLFGFSPTGGLTEISAAINTITNKTVNSVDWSPAGDLLAVGLGDVVATGSEVRIYQFNRGAGTLTLLHEAEDTRPVNTVRWSHSGSYLAVGDDMYVNIYRVSYADLAITKTGTPALVRPGSNLIYRIVVTNSGPDSAESVVVTDTLPSTNTVTFLSATSTVGTCAQTSGLVTCVIGNLDAGQTVAITVTVKVAASAFGAITNNAQVVSATLAHSIANNFAIYVALLDTDGDGVPDIYDGSPRTNTGPAVLDFDGDTRSDLAVFWPSGGAWNVLKSSGRPSPTVQLGYTGSFPVAGDYDGDGIADYAVFYPPNGNWYILPSITTNLVVRNWGWSREVAVPGDYDGDRKTDLAVFDPPTVTWYILNSSNNQLRVQSWGVSSNSIPVPGDYDGDGRTDVATYDPAIGMWYIINSSNTTYRYQNWGWFRAMPVPADYDGDHKTDIAVYVPGSGQWSILNSRDGSVRQLNWGWSQAIPVPADYDGDGKADIAVFVPAEGNWYILNSHDGSLRVQNWGWIQTVPVAPQVQINRHYFPAP